jgi:hypothetical protein
MDLTAMLGNMATDLKMTLDSEFSTAEGTRAIWKAVDIMSRKLPRELVYDHTWRQAVTDDSFSVPAALDVDRFVDAMDISDSVDGDLATLTSTLIPTIPQPVTILVTDADVSITQFTIIVKGMDVDGVYREESFYRYNGLSQTGKIYFKAIQEVEINEISGNGAADTLDVGVPAGTDIWINLSNPLESGTDAIYSGSGKSGTKYTRDTDYEVDNQNGRIKVLSSGDMSAGTTYYANYSRSPVSINIEDILPGLLRVVRVKYPEGKMPEQFVGYNIWGNQLTITAQRQGQSQQAFVDKEHITIFYEAKHAPPTLYGGGSYPEVLDEVVLIGACGFVLEFKALEQELQAITDIASLRTELGYTTTVHATISTALGKAASMLTLTTGEIDIALGKVATYLETNGTTDNAKEILADISDNAADLRTKIIVAMDAINSALDGVSTISLDKATTGAEAYLDTGDDTINQLNDGGVNVPAYYSEYSKSRVAIGQTRIQTAAGYLQEVNSRLAMLTSYIQESQGWVGIANSFIQEAAQRISSVNAAINEANSRLYQIDRYLAEAGLYQNAAEGCMILADRFRAESSTRQSEFYRILNTKAEYRKRVVTVPGRQPA